ncbi:MAG TPA: SRPBCC domain-containing protein [Mycobacteriales bacterium]|nr:SRPBCC domain-containing protein [Mycobacteriales bacterium]
MTTMTGTTGTVQVYRVYIRATPEAIWEAITTPEWTQRYGYGSPVEYELRPGGAYRGLATAEMKAMGGEDVVVDGEVLEADPPRRLVQTWRARWLGEGFTRLTWEIEEGDSGVTTLTVTHDVDGAPSTAAQVAGTVPNAGGGWSYILSDLKTLLETGRPLAG